MSSSSSSSPPPILDLWAQYWNCNPLLETWHCQTFARQVSQNFASSSKEWTPEIKKTIEVVADDFRVKNIRTFFALNTVDENTNITNNNQKEEKQQEQENNDDAAQQQASSSSSSDLLPSTILQFQTNSSSASKPRELFDLFLTLLTSTQENQQPVILDFQFVPVPVPSEGSSSTSSSSSAFVTFTTPIIAQRIASGLQGMAQVKVLSQKDAALHRKNNKAALSSSNVLTLRATSDAAEPIFRNNARALQVLFNIFGGNPKLSQVPRKIGGTAYQIEFSSSSNNNSQKCPKRLLLSKEQDFSSHQHLLSSSEDAAPQESNDCSITNEDVLQFLASGQECAAVALATLQRPLAEDWGLMLTFERK